ncbi:hypothetical protein A2U01_0022636, partial [Trifolium medium]|nr:hypothetical protein [Trifolium medium]
IKGEEHHATLQYFTGHPILPDVGLGTPLFPSPYHSTALEKHPGGCTLHTTICSAFPVSLPVGCFFEPPATSSDTN